MAARLRRQDVESKLRRIRPHGRRVVRTRECFSRQSRRRYFMTEQAISAVTTGVPHRTWRTLGASLVPLALVVAALAVLLGSRQWDAWLERRPVQSTDDAQLRSDITQLSTKASGIVAEVAVDDYQRVKAGDLLVRLQDDDFRAQVALAQAAVVASEAALENLHSQKHLQASRVAEADANIGAASADLERARLERIR